MALASSALGAGPVGLAALVILIIAGVVGVIFFTRAINKRTDARDLANAGADAGETAANLKKQASDARTQLDELEKAYPPGGEDKK